MASATGTRLPARLQLLNLARWLREYLLVWGFLSFIYSLTLTVLLQPMLERALKIEEAPFVPLWATSCLLLLVPGALEHLPLPALPFRAPRLPAALGPLAPIYLRHELRRGSCWLTIFVAVVAAGFMPAKKIPLWLLIAQLPMQRALYSVHSWRKLALTGLPKQGAAALMKAIWTSQLSQALVIWIALGISRFVPVEQWWGFGPALIGGALAAGATSMEGDSGRPWLVNFMAMAAGTLGAYLCLASPWFLLLIIYACSSMIGVVAGRLHSVEHLDEDTIIP